MPAEALSECPGCGRETKTAFGRCPQCGYAKKPEALPYSENYIARGPGPGPGLPLAGGFLGLVGMGAVPGLAIAALGLFVVDSLAVAIAGVVVLVVGSVASLALGGDGL